MTTVLGSVRSGTGQTRAGCGADLGSWLARPRCTPRPPPASWKSQATCWCWWQAARSYLRVCSQSRSKPVGKARSALSPRWTRRWLGSARGQTWALAGRASNTHASWRTRDRRPTRASARRARARAPADMAVAGSMSWLGAPACGATSGRDCRGLPGAEAGGALGLLAACHSTPLEAAPPSVGSR